MKGVNLNFLTFSPTIKKWSNVIIKHTEEYVDSQKYITITSLLTSLKQKTAFELKSLYIMLELEHELFNEHVNQILSVDTNIKLIGIGYPKEIETVKNLLVLGINGFIDISATELELLNAIKTINDNRIYLSPNYINQLIINVIQNTVEGKNNQQEIHKNIELTLNSFELSKKESIVVDYLIKGYSYKQIASLIGVTPFAINQRVKSLYKKCGVKSRNELSYLLLK